MWSIDVKVIYLADLREPFVYCQLKKTVGLTFISLE